MKVHLKTETPENKDLSGVFEDGYLKNANFSCVCIEKQIQTFDTDIHVMYIVYLSLHGCRKC